MSKVIYPGMNERTNDYKPRTIQVNFPWPPGQMGTSNVEMTSRVDAERALAGLSNEVVAGKLSLEDFVWTVRRRPDGKLWLYMFHADCVPSSAPGRQPWVWRKLSEKPPPDPEWEMVFLPQVTPPKES